MVVIGVDDADSGISSVLVDISSQPRDASELN